MLSASQLTQLSQPYSATPLGRLSTLDKTADRFRKLFVANFGPKSAAMAEEVIKAADLDQAKARIALFAQYGNREDDSALKAAPIKPGKKTLVDRIADADREIAKKPRQPRADKMLAAAAEGTMPTPPDFTAPTHARYRAKREALIALAEAGDIEGLRAFEIKPISSSPKALDKYRNAAVAALTARKGA